MVEFTKRCVFEIRPTRQLLPRRSALAASVVAHDSAMRLLQLTTARCGAHDSALQLTTAASAASAAVASVGAVGAVDVASERLQHVGSQRN